MQSDGATEAQHRDSAARQLAKLGRTRTAVVAAGPPEPPFPDRVGYLWTWFCEVDGGIGANGFTAPTVTWDALAAWSAVTRTAVEPWEAEALVRLGLVRAAIVAEHEAKRRAAEKSQRR